VGYVPRAGEEVVIIEDVITAGTAIRESMGLLSALEGVKVAAAFVMVDRRERGQGTRAATREVQETYGFPVYSIADVYDILEYLEETPEGRVHAGRIRAYLEEYGDKA
jgi:orotate phosphoribosyltransferase